MQQMNYTDLDADIVSLYVETETGMIFEAKLFEDYAILRPASPELFRYIRKISHDTLAKDYEDFCGNRQDVLDHLTTGSPMAFKQETRH